MARENKNQTERLVILLTPGEMDDFRTRAFFEKKKLSEMGREIIIKYTNDYIVQTRNALIDKQKQIENTHNNPDLLPDWMTESTKKRIAQTIPNKIDKKQELKDAMKSWTDDSIQPVNDEVESVQNEPIEDAPVQESTTEPIPDDLNTIQVKFKINNKGHGRKWSIETLNIIDLEPKRFNELEKHIIHWSNKLNETDVETLRDRLQNRARIPFTMDEIISVILKSKRFKYDQYTWTYELI